MSKLQATIAGALLIDMGYAEDDQEVPPQVAAKVEVTAAAVAAALPANAGLDFLTVMETWGDSENATTASLIDMVIAATLLQLNPGAVDYSITVTSADLRAVLEQYHIERTETDGSWTLRVQKISEMSSANG